MTYIELMSTSRKNLGRKRQIENQATKLFEARGFAATSMRDLAMELQIEAASIYSHIKSKDELLRTICFSMADTFFDAIDGISSSAMGPIEKLKAAMTAHLEVITQNSSAAAVFFSEWRHLREPFLSEFLKMRESYENQFLGILKDGVQKNELDVDDPKFVVRMLFNSMNWIHTWYKPEGTMSPKEISLKIFDLVVNGIGSKKAVL